MPPHCISLSGQLRLIDEDRHVALRHEAAVQWSCGESAVFHVPGVLSPEVVGRHDGNRHRLIWCSLPRERHRRRVLRHCTLFLVIEESSIKSPSVNRRSLHNHTSSMPSLRRTRSLEDVLLLCTCCLGCPSESAAAWQQQNASNREATKQQVLPWHRRRGCRLELPLLASFCLPLGCAAARRCELHKYVVGGLNVALQRSVELAVTKLCHAGVMY